MNTEAQHDITAYVDAVRAALAGLPEATREELLEDLPEHLAEVQAEGTGTLTERLGSPEAYAAELRATAGFVGGFPDPPSKWVPFSEVLDNTMRLLNRADLWAGPALGYQRAGQFLALLRPGWWVLRGYLAAMALAYLLDRGGQPIGLLPRVGGSTVIALLLLVGGVLVSIWLGRRDLRDKPWPRYALWSGTAVLILVALAGFVAADDSVRAPIYQDANYNRSEPGMQDAYLGVQDVFVYDAQGRLVTGARIFDQDGTPIQLGTPGCGDPTTGEWTRTRRLGYPYCPQNAPFETGPPTDPLGRVTPTPSPGASGATPSPSASVSGGSSVSPAPGPTSRR